MLNRTFSLQRRRAKPDDARTAGRPVPARSGQEPGARKGRPLLDTYTRDDGGRSRPDGSTRRRCSPRSGRRYDRYARLLSFGQDPRWRRFLVSRIEAGPADTVLDVATGTGAVAAELLRPQGLPVVGLDQSPEMLAEARRRLPADVRARRGRGRQPAVRGRLVRRAHLHVPAPLRRRSGARRCASWRASSGPAARSPGSSSACRRTRPRAPLWRLYVRVGLPLAGPADLARLARGRRLPRPEHRGALAAAPARAAARALARRPGSRTSATGDSASAAGS